MSGDRQTEGRPGGRWGLRGPAAHRRVLIAAVLAVTLIAVAPGRPRAAAPAPGPVLAWGDNTYPPNNSLGKLGPNAAGGYSPEPVVVPNLDGGVAKVAAGEFHSLALMADGTVRAWGAGREGQLGQGAIASSPVPVPVRDLAGVVDVAVGQRHSLALTSDGSVWAWGSDVCGQLGSGPGSGIVGSSSLVPKKVGGLPAGVRAIAAGRAFNLVLDGDGRLWAWGDNRSGQLGNGAAPQPHGPTIFACYQRGDTGTSQPVPTPVALPEQVVTFAAGGDHALAITTSGLVWSWGSNCEGQLGTPAGLGPNPVPGRGQPQPVGGLPSAKVVAVAAGGEDFGGHSLALTDTGQVWAWGLAEVLGAGTPAGDPSPCTNVDFPLSRGPGHPVPVLVEGAGGAPVVGVAALAAGTAHTVAVGADGSMLAWGRNDRGQLGLGGAATRSSAVTIGLTGTAGGQVVSLASASRHVVAVLGPTPPARPAPKFTGVVPPLPDPGAIVPGAGPVEEALRDQQQALDEARAGAEEQAGDAAANGPARAERAVVDAYQHNEGALDAAREDARDGAGQLVDQPAAGALVGRPPGGGRLLVAAQHADRWMVCPTAVCTGGGTNAAGSRTVFKRVVTWANAADHPPRLLYVLGGHQPVYASGTDHWSTVADAMVQMGFQLGCPPGGGAPAREPGCYDAADTPTAWSADGITRERTNARPLDQYRFADYDVVLFGNGLDPAGVSADIAPRRGELYDFVNRTGGGVVVLAQANLGTPKGILGFVEGERWDVVGGGADVATPEGRAALGLSEADLAGVGTLEWFETACFVPFVTARGQTTMMGYQGPIPPPEQGPCPPQARIGAVPPAPRLDLLQLPAIVPPQAPAPGAPEPLRPAPPLTNPLPAPAPGAAPSPAPAPAAAPALAPALAPAVAPAPAPAAATSPANAQATAPGSAPGTAAGNATGAAPAAAAGAAPAAAPAGAQAPAGASGVAAEREEAPQVQAARADDGSRQPASEELLASSRRGGDPVLPVSVSAIATALALALGRGLRRRSPQWRPARARVEAGRSDPTASDRLRRLRGLR